MPSNFDEAFARVKQLVADFKANEKFYLSAQFSEAQARKDFLDKFFMALGWDVNHDTQKNPYEQEVKIERNESGSQRRADYAFFLSPNFRDVRFLVEAKKPHGEFGSPDNYFQTLGYGWRNKTKIAALTNFEEFHILDCRYRPNIGDTLSRVVKRLSYADYADSEKFAEIYWLFSREAVANNSLTKFAETLPKPKSRTFRRELFKTGDKDIDESFLIELDGYREMLAKAFKAKNPDLKSEQLTEVTQRTLDRLVFIRFLEDKLIEPQRHVERFGAEGGSVWEDFIRVSLNLDRTYNGVVFKRHDILDAPGFQIDEKPFRIICEELSDPTSVYHFNDIPIHILGSIYERFLGKIITDGARVEEKPEVRKAGGVYYTPEYIVRYIVANTVGKLIEGKTPAEIAGMHFADIACGSGSFLLEVFDSLLRYHTKYYNENPGKAKKDCIKRDDGLHLSLKKKHEILQNNIYGVDIDRQAVEVAQLSLYLKLLEDETPGSAHAFQSEFHYTLLPPLMDNIVCGNSLIGTDILETGDFTPEEERKLNPMDFEQRFPKIFRRKSSGGELRETSAADLDYTMPGVPLHGAYAKASYRKKKEEKPITLPKMEYEGGFDAIVGNPPYALVGADQRVQQEYFTSGRFRLTAYKINLYLLFLERALELLKKESGRLGYIIPKSLAFNTYFASTRMQLLQNFAIPLLVEIRDKVFAQAEVGDSLLFFAEKKRPTDTSEVWYKVVNNISPAETIIEEFKRPNFRLFSEEGAYFRPRDFVLNTRTVALASRWRVNNGLNPGNVRHILFADKKKSPKFRRLLLGRNLQRYLLSWSGTWVNFDPSLKTKLRPSDIRSKPGMTAQTKVDFALRSPEIYEPIKVMVRKTADRIVACLDSEDFCFDSLSYGIQPINGTDESPFYLVGLLNSKFLNRIHEGISQNKEKVFAKVLAENLNKLPLPILDLSKTRDKSHHDRMVSLVEKMLEARKQLSAARTDGDKDFYENKCATLDRQIDALVYELYGLTEDEIKIVEGQI